MAKSRGKAKESIPASVAEKETTGEVELSDAEEQGEEDDHTAALLTGFESSGDERDGDDQGFSEGQSVPTIPEQTKAKSKSKAVTKTSAGNSQGPGVVYVGYILCASCY